MAPVKTCARPSSRWLTGFLSPRERLNPGPHQRKSNLCFTRTGVRRGSSTVSSSKTAWIAAAQIAYASRVRKSSPQVPLSEAFVTFFSGVDHWTHLLHGGRPELSTRLRVRAMLDNNLRQLVIRVDDKDVTLLAGGPDQVISWDGGSHKFGVTGVFGAENESVPLFGLYSGPWEIFNWLWNAKALGSGEFTWRPTAGKFSELRLKNGGPMAYRLRIQLDDGSGPLSLSLGQCVPPTGR